ncbi:MAG: hypothetical protein ACRCXC_02450 [Legionella sp.]
MGGWPGDWLTLPADSQWANAPWILKPSMLNNGQHIHLFHDLNAIEAHFLSSQRMG